MARKKYYTVYFLFFGLLSLQAIFLVGCKKGFEVPPATASLRIAHVIPGVPALLTSFQGKQSLEYYSTAARMSYGSSNLKGNYINRPAGECNLAFYRFADTVNPAQPFMQVDLELLPNNYYSLFLTGTAGAPETLFLKEQFDPITDSSTGIRFINLSPGSEALTVNLVHQENTPEVADLSYKSASDFIIYPAHSKVNNYTFEIRNKRTGDKLITYTTSAINANPSSLGSPKNNWLFKRATLMITGLPGGAGDAAMKVELINHI